MNSKSYIIFFCLVVVAITSAAISGIFCMDKGYNQAKLEFQTQQAKATCLKNYSNTIIKKVPKACIKYFQ